MGIKFNPSPSILGTPATASGDMRVLNNLNVDGVLSASGVSGGGESNTASNLAGDEGLFSSKVGVDLRFRSITAGSNITLTSGSTAVTIAASAGASPGGADTAVQFNNNGTLSGNVNFIYNGSGSLSASSNISGSAFYGSGANLTALNAGNISAGSLANARLTSPIDVTIVSGSTAVSGAVGQFHQLTGTLSTLGTITATSLSASSTVSGSSFYGDGSNLTGISAGAVSSYTNSTDNRVITSVDSSTINGEANLTFDGTTLTVAGTISGSGNISGSAFYGDGSSLSGVSTTIDYAQIALYAQVFGG